MLKIIKFKCSKLTKYIGNGKFNLTIPKVHFLFYKFMKKTDCLINCDIFYITAKKYCNSSILYIRGRAYFYLTPSTSSPLSMRKDTVML